MKRVFMEGITGRRNKGYTPVWIVQDWITWKYYAHKILDRWMHLLRKIPGAGKLVDEVWEYEYHWHSFDWERIQIVNVTWDKVGPRWNWARPKGETSGKENDNYSNNSSRRN